MDEPAKRSPVRFLVLVFALSVPFYLLGSLSDRLSTALGVNLPVSALGALCPLASALVLVYREERREGVKRLLRRLLDSDDSEGRQPRRWYLVALLLMPGILLLSYGVMRLLAMPLPEAHFRPLAVPLLLGAFLLGAVGEEGGWSGYLTDALQARWGALATGLILGVIGASWHVLPLIQTHHSAAWIACQCFTIAATRVLIVWVYNNAARSTLSAVIVHATYNLSVFVFPNDGSHYNPAIVGAIMAVGVVVVTRWWGAQTLARFPGT
jgi:hypothetical protein